MVMEFLAIGEVAGRSGMAPSALRYYEEQGLIEATRTPGGPGAIGGACFAGSLDPRGAQRRALAAEIAAALDTLPPGRTPDGRRLGAAVGGVAGPAGRADRRALAATGRPLSCIGCGCLSVEKCALSNPNDARPPRAPVPAGASGPAPSRRFCWSRRAQKRPLRLRWGTERITESSGEVHDRHACGVHRALEPDERARDQPLHRGLAGVRAGGAPSPRHPGDLGALVRAGDGRDRDATAAHHPRLLRLSARAVRRALRAARACPRCTRRSPTSCTRPGWAPTWTAGASTTAPGRC